VDMWLFLLKQLMYFTPEEITLEYLIKQSQSVHRNMVRSPNSSKAHGREERFSYIRIRNLCFGG